MAPSKWLVIVSPVSGKRQGVKVVTEELMPELKRLGVQADVKVTERARHAVEIAAQYGSSDCGLVAVGGDGTISEVLLGLSQNGKLGDTPVAVLSFGSLNFYGNCAGLPLQPKDLAQFMARNEIRPSSLMRLNTNGQDLISFEAAHIGQMAYKVCKGAGDWRSTLGPMFGIFLHLIGGNLFPDTRRGTLKIYPADGSSPLTVKDDFFWIILTHRSVYNGAVGREMWVSYLTKDTFPGFGRMMGDFFAPEMEHFGGTARCFGSHFRAVKVEFVLDDPKDKIALVIDGDACSAGNTLVVHNVERAFSVVASREFPTSVAEAKVSPKTLTPAAEKWLKVNPPPKGVVLSPVTKVAVASESSKWKRRWLVVAVLVLYVLWRRRG